MRGCPGRAGQTVDTAAGPDRQRGRGRRQRTRPRPRGLRRSRERPRRAVPGPGEDLRRHPWRGRRDGHGAGDHPRLQQAVREHHGGARLPGGGAGLLGQGGHRPPGEGPGGRRLGQQRRASAPSPRGGSSRSWSPWPGPTATTSRTTSRRAWTRSRHDGKLYGLPWGGHPGYQGLLYNEDLLQPAGHKRPGRHLDLGPADRGGQGGHPRQWRRQHGRLRLHPLHPPGLPGPDPPSCGATARTGSTRRARS